MTPSTTYPVFCDWVDMSVPVDDVAHDLNKTLTMGSAKHLDWVRPAWTTIKHSRPVHQTSSASSVQVRHNAHDRILKVSGNLGRWGKPENVWGVGVYASSMRFIDYLHANNICRLIGKPRYTRLDLTANIAFANKRDAYDWISWSTTKRIGRKQPLIYDTGVSWVTENWSIKCYDKLADLKRQKLVALADTLEAEIGYILRLETTLRSDELQRLEAQYPENWLNSEDKMSVIFTDKFAPLIKGSGVTIDELSRELPTRLAMALEAWRNGHNFRNAVSDGRMSRSTYQRLRRDMLGYSIDISMPCNVTKLSIKPREIMPQFVDAPNWYRRIA